MSQIYASTTAVSPAPSGAVQGVKTDTAGVVIKPDGSGNISIVGGPGVNVAGAGSVATINTTGDKTAIGRIDVDKGQSIIPNTDGVIDIEGGEGIEVRKTGANAIVVAETGGGRDISAITTPQGNVYPTPDGKVTFKGEGRAVIRGDIASNSIAVNVDTTGDSFLTDSLPTKPVLPNAEGRVKLEGGEAIRTVGNPGTNSVVFQFTGRYVKTIGADNGKAALPQLSNGEIWLLGLNGLETIASGENNIITFSTDAIRRFTIPTGAVGPKSNGDIAFEAGEGMSISLARNAIRFSASRDGSFIWQAVGAGRPLQNGYGYISVSETPQNFPLPTLAAPGDVFEVAQFAGGVVRITQGANQRVRFGNQISTTGTAGYWESRMPGASLRLVCVLANSTFMAVTGAIGNWIRG